MISNSSINIVWWKFFCGSTNFMNDAITSFDQSTSAINSEKEWFAHIRFINSYLRYLSLIWIQIMWLKSVIWQKLVFLKQLFGHKQVQLWSTIMVQNKPCWFIYFQNVTNEFLHIVTHIHFNIEIRYNNCASYILQHAMNDQFKNKPASK